MKKLLYKIFGMIINIDVLLQLLLLLGVLFVMLDSMAHYGKIILVTASLLFTLIIMSPLAKWSLMYLENYYPRLDKLPADIKGMIILGGSFNRRATIDRGMTCYNSAGARFIHAVELANQYPKLSIVFTGGGIPLPGIRFSKTEADIARSEFIKLNIDLSRITFEDQSINTRDNAYMSYQMIKPQPCDKWLLVTSASHMPRSMGLFKKVGWNVVAYPVDYQTGTEIKYQFSFRIAENLTIWLRASREWCGLLSNWILNFSDHILPPK